MKLFALKCDQGYLRGTDTDCQCVELEKATVVNGAGMDRIDALAEKAVQAGYKNVVMVELIVMERNVLRSYS